MNLKYNDSPFEYKRLETRVVQVGQVSIGGLNPIRIQSMTTSDTMDTKSTVQQIIALESVGCEIVRLTVPSMPDAENLVNIRNDLKKVNSKVPIVADIHFTPSVAMKVVEYVEKVRINPGNFVDKKKFQTIEYSDSQYNQELDRVRETFLPLVKRCKELGVAMRIGVNHGSLSDRIMNRFGDTPNGMTESALEFIRIAESESYYDLVISMKSSNPRVMVAAYRTIAKRFLELKMKYPFHLGVTEAGDGNDGRIKSSMGISSLLEDGIGDTIRVSLTEEAINEIPAANTIAKKYIQIQKEPFLLNYKTDMNLYKEFRNPFEYSRFYSSKITIKNLQIGENHTVLIESSIQLKDFSKLELEENILELTNKQNKYKPDIFHFIINNQDELNFIHSIKSKYDIPFSIQLNVLTLKDIQNEVVKIIPKFDKISIYPFNHDWDSIFNKLIYNLLNKNIPIEFILRDIDLKNIDKLIDYIHKHEIHSVLFSLDAIDFIHEYRKLASLLSNHNFPILLNGTYTSEESIIFEASRDLGSILIDGIGDIIRIHAKEVNLKNTVSTSYDILQAARVRISKTDYISCPSCGRTLYNIQTVVEKIKQKTNHLDGVKIAVMGCIVNGPGEMADADFGYVGAGPGKIHLYKGKEIVKKSIPAETAVEELVNLIKSYNMWKDP